MVRDRTLPDGTYTLTLRAVDRVGNATEATTSVTLVGTQPPDAQITSVRFTPTQVIYGNVIKVEITVKNTGPTVLKTFGPEPGFTYTTRDTFASIAEGRYASQLNRWRVGVDWAGGLGPEGERYPYRWGLGHDLAPGEETTIVGYLRIMERYPEIWLYAGLVREGIGYHVNRVGQQLIKVSY
ncbi:MAG: hypothetical protein HYX89_03800 [Chloroflexi bacterium]|nr:hypothetical protein [Chloroflexota bacterium]